jgi:hypothetical protein
MDHQVGASPAPTCGRVPFHGRHVMVGDLMAVIAVRVPRSNTAYLSAPAMPHLIRVGGA